MTWSLRLSNGDLVKGKGNSLSTVTGPDKVAQDLFAWFLEPYGSDPLNPNLGSFIDYPEGMVVNLNGEEYVLPKNYRDLVVSEINRLLTDYVRRQRVRIRLEAGLYDGKHTLQEDEIIGDYEVIAEQVEDTLFVNITLTFSDGDSVDLEIPVENRSEAL